MSALSARIADAKGDRSIDAIAAQAEQRGHKIDRATVARYVQGKHAKRPPDTVLVALAEGLGIDVRELRELAGMPRGELGPWEPPAEAAQLSADQRSALDQLIKAIVNQEDSGDGTTRQKISTGAGGGTADAGPAPTKHADTMQIDNEQAPDDQSLSDVGPGTYDLPQRTSGAAVRKRRRQVGASGDSGQPEPRGDRSRDPGQ